MDAGAGCNWTHGQLYSEREITATSPQGGFLFLVTIRQLIKVEVVPHMVRIVFWGGGSQWLRYEDLTNLT